MRSPYFEGAKVGISCLFSLIKGTFSAQPRIHPSVLGLKKCALYAGIYSSHHCAEQYNIEPQEMKGSKYK